MRLRVAAALLTLAACSRTTEGPTPTVSSTTNPQQPSVQPARVCNAQGAPNGWRVTLAGGGFAPMPQDVLTDAPRVGLPEVTLRGPGTATLARERVFFVSPTQLDLDVPTRDTSPAADLAPGSYTVEVKNPSGATGSLADALLVVPPPTLTGADAPGGFTQTAPSAVELTGSGFRTDEAPTVVLRAAGLPDVTLTDVAVSSATLVTANVPPNTAAGTYDVVLTNPEGCSFTLPQGLVISYVRLGTLSLDPRFGWQRQNTSVTLFNAPTGVDQKAFSSGSPEIFLFAPLKADPTKPVEIPLRRTAFLSGTTVTAVVPTCSGNAALPLTDPECPNGIVPGGPYELRVKDPSGATGTISAANGFTVLENPAPAITSISPSAINTQDLAPATNPLVVTGQNFGAGARVQLLSKLTSGNILACDLAPTGTQSDTKLQAVVPGTIDAALCAEYTATGTKVTASTGLTVAAGFYVVRVQNNDNPAYANYSGLIVTNPAGKPSNGPALTTKLAVPRANFPLVLATDDFGQPFLYALGGTNGTTTLASVEVAPVTLFGELGGQCTGSTCTFRTLERSALGAGAGATPVARRGATAVVRTVPGDTSYLFVLGGIRADGTAMNTVERAQVLKVADAPGLLPPTVGTGGTLPAGTFYYRVSAVRDAADPKNPGGETLPSDEYPVTVGTAGAATTSLSWPCIPGAAKYRVYRTAEANAVSGSELLLDEVAATAGSCTGSPLPNVSYTDTGAKTPAGDAPLPPGALGKWASAGTLLNERGNAAARLVDDTVYVSGGFCSTVVTTLCPSAGTTLASVERATFAANTADLGTFAAAGTLNKARQRHSLALANSTTAPGAFTSTTAPDNRQDAWLLAVGGDAGGAPLTTGDIEVGQVKNAAGIIAAPVFTQASYNTADTHGGWAEVVSNFLLQTGATGGAGIAFRFNLVCGGSKDPAQCTTATSFGGTLTAASISYLSGGPRYLSGNVLYRAFVYAAGGFPNDAGGTPTDTVERLIY